MLSDEGHQHVGKANEQIREGAPPVEDIFGANVGTPGRGAAHDVRDADSGLPHPFHVAQGERAAGEEAACFDRFPEAVPRIGEMNSKPRGLDAGIDADEEETRIFREHIGDAVRFDRGPATRAGARPLLFETSDPYGRIAAPAVPAWLAALRSR